VADTPSPAWVFFSCIASFACIELATLLAEAQQSFVGDVVCTAHLTRFVACTVGFYNYPLL